MDDSASQALGINGGIGIGKRLDGWPNRDLNTGAIIALSPTWDDATVALLNSWGPGMYDPRFNFDGKSNPVVIPPAYGLFGLERGQATCATCHSGELFTDATEGVLHPITASAAAETDYALRSATKQWRTAPLKGLWQHAPYFHGGSAETLADVVAAYDSKLDLGLSEAQQSDLTEFLKSL